MHMLPPVYGMGKWSGGYNLQSLNSGTETNCEQSKVQISILIAKVWSIPQFNVVHLLLHNVDLWRAMLTQPRVQKYSTTVARVWFQRGE